VCDRDVNAAHVILQYALNEQLTGQELALGVEEEQEKFFAPLLKHETPFIPEAALADDG
jgi:hypothetical protein